jgi:hypothetical protein
MTVHDRFTEDFGTRRPRPPAQPLLAQPSPARDMIELQALLDAPANAPLPGIDLSPDMLAAMAARMDRYAASRRPTPSSPPETPARANEENRP